MATEARSLEYTPTWIVAVVCSVIVLISLVVERLLHRLGKLLKHKNQDALFEALQKVKEELMLLGFISLLLTVSQGLIGGICIPEHLTTYMLPCKIPTFREETHDLQVYFTRTTSNRRRLLSHGIISKHCMKIRQWKRWEDSIKRSKDGKASTMVHSSLTHQHLQDFRQRAEGFWRKSTVTSWIMSFFKQFYGSVTKTDYIALRYGFIMMHFPSNPDYDFHKYMMRTLQVDFKKVVGISWYLWLFVVIFLLLNIEGWHTYFWLSFLPLILLLLVGGKLEHIITCLAEDVAERKTNDQGEQQVKPSNKHFWFGRPRIVIYLIHFILFQNSFEIAFFFWIWVSYGFDSCILDKVAYIIPRLVIGVIVQVLCSYSTLPLYALVTQMGSTFKHGIFEQDVHTSLTGWYEGAKEKKQKGICFRCLKFFGSRNTKDSSSSALEMQTQANEAVTNTDIIEQTAVVIERSLDTNN